MKSSTPPARRLSLDLATKALKLAVIISCFAGASSPAATSIVAWGNNNNFQCNVPTGLTAVNALAAGTIHSLAIRPDGTVAAWGDNLFGQTNVTGLASVAAIAGGDTFTMALLSNGTVVVRGTQVAPPVGLSNVTAIAAGWHHCLALKQDGTVVSWGDTNSVPAGLSNVIAIAAGDGHSLALLKDRSVRAWGDSSFGKTTVPATATNVAAIVAGKDHCLALRINGSVVAWGNNSNGQGVVPAGLVNVVGIGAGAFHNVALRLNGTLTAWGSSLYNQTNVPTYPGFFRVTAGGYHNLASLGDGAPGITVQPASQSVPIANDATFFVMAAGAQPMAYQWRFNGTNVAGATNSTLTIANIQTNNGGAYSVLITNLNGGTVSADAILIPAFDPPNITIQPQNVTRSCGETAVLTVTAQGLKPFSYQWQFEGSPVAGATRSILQLANVTPAQAGNYTVVVTNTVGVTTSTVAQVSVTVDPPLITSPLTKTGRQGHFLSYTIHAQHNPTKFAAPALPFGLSLNPDTGVISGIPQEVGTFLADITAINACTSQTETLTFVIDSGAPVITSPTTANATESANFNYQIVATESPTLYFAENLPLGLILDPVTGKISGAPVFGGTKTAVISAANAYGTNSVPLAFTIAYRLISDLSITDVAASYSTPYLLDFEFALRDNLDPNLGDSVAFSREDVTNLIVTATEDGVPVSPTETGARLILGSPKQLKVNLVLDFTASLADLGNGDADFDGISDAIEGIVSGAQRFVNDQPHDALIGAYEFHREDQDPQQVVPLTTDKRLLNDSIEGIWTNYVKNFSASSRCWDALGAAITGLGATNKDERKYIVFVSDGSDESSALTITNVIEQALAAGVKIYCIGFAGSEGQINTDALTNITTQTHGHYYEALTSSDLPKQFGQVSKDLSSLFSLRWATLKRAGTNQPTFIIKYGTLMATAVTKIKLPDIVEVDDTTNPPIVKVTKTNLVFIPPYVPTEHAGSVSLGSLKLATNGGLPNTLITLRSAYTPRFIRQIRIHYRANWPVTAMLAPTNFPGGVDILYNWTMTETNDGAGGKWLLLSSAYPQSVSNSIPFAAFGDLVYFNFEDNINPASAFSLMEVDNTLPTYSGGQSFVFQNTNAFVTVYTNLPLGTPIPWLMSHGINNNFAAAELLDPDGDGMLTWQEYRANTDPQNANSRLVVRAISSDVFGRNEITFSSAPNRQYRLESTSDLSTWETVEDNIPGTGGDITVVDHRYIPLVPAVFYRVLVY